MVHLCYASSHLTCDSFEAMAPFAMKISSAKLIKGEWSTKQSYNVCRFIKSGLCGILFAQHVAYLFQKFDLLNKTYLKWINFRED